MSSAHPNLLAPLPLDPIRLAHIVQLTVLARPAGGRTYLALCGELVTVSRAEMKSESKHLPVCRKCASR